MEETIRTAHRDPIPGRRLTPLECCRLQGYPDGWCKGLESADPAEEEISRWEKVFAAWEAVQGKRKPKTRKLIINWLRHPNTDAAEYMAYGNSVAVPCAFSFSTYRVGSGRELSNEKFWDWIKNEDTGLRELWLEGVIGKIAWGRRGHARDLQGGNCTPEAARRPPHHSRAATASLASPDLHLAHDYPRSDPSRSTACRQRCSVIAMAARPWHEPTALMMGTILTTAMGDEEEMQKNRLLSEVMVSIINARTDQKRLSGRSFPASWSRNWLTPTRRRSWASATMVL
jgi:hypothetical protein